MDPAFIFRRFQGSAVAAALALLLLPPVGCSSSGEGPPACVSSRCPAGNECIDDGSGKGLSCHQVCTNSSECPFNTFCNDGQPKSWCVASTYPVPQLPTGQWGTICSPTGGAANNPDCDGADGFACYGTSPTDASAFCTVFGCTVDTDCPGSWWCATVNQAPNVKTDTPSFGPTLHACLPREYCAPCKLDHDCPAAAGGTQQHCASDSQGNGYCTTECSTDANCNLDATCKNWQSLCTPAQGASCQSDEDCLPVAGVVQHCDGARCTPECGADSDCLASELVNAPEVGDARAPDGGSAPVSGDAGALVNGKCEWRGLCTPRAGVCLGNGGFCSPCRSDADCTNGYCISGAPYSTERFCSFKSTKIPCDTMDANPAGCPAHNTSDHWVLNGCVTTPSNQCEGFVVLGSSTGSAEELPGCWTANR
jgi:hypothetical protein